MFWILAVGNAGLEALKSSILYGKITSFNAVDLYCPIKLKVARCVHAVVLGRTRSQSPFLSGFSIVQL